MALIQEDKGILLEDNASSELGLGQIPFVQEDGLFGGPKRTCMVLLSVSWRTTENSQTTTEVGEMSRNHCRARLNE